MLYQFKRNDAAFQTIRHFNFFVAFLYQFISRFYHSYRFNTFLLYGLNVVGNTLPVVSQCLIGCISVDEKHPMQTGKNIIGNSIQLFLGICSRYLINQPMMNTIGKTFKSLCKPLLESSYVCILFYNRLSIFGLQLRIRFVCICYKQLLAQRRKCVPIFLKFVNLTVRNASEYGGIDVELLNRVAGIYITRYIQIVTVLTDFITGHYTGISGNRFAVAYRIGNTFNITFAQLVVFSFLDKTFRGIDNQHVVIVTMLFEHHNEGRNTCTKENIGRQSDNGIDVVLLNKVTTDFAFSFTIFISITTEENPVRKHNRQDSVRFKVMELMKQKGVVSFAFRSYTIILETCIQFTVVGIPLLRIRRIADNSIHVKRFSDVSTVSLQRPVLFQRVGTAGIYIIRFDTTHHQVHTGQVVSVFLQFLSIIFHLVLVFDMASNRFTDSDQQRT